MARRKREKPIAVDRAFWRGNNLNTRLRVALWTVEPSLAAAFTEERLQANHRADPHRRLRELEALTDKVRRLCPPGRRPPHAARITHRSESRGAT